MLLNSKMAWFRLLAVFALGIASVSAGNGGCRHPIVRKEWRTLSNNQKSAYIQAVKCLQSKPARTQNLYPGVRSRFDDYVATHINITDIYHFSGPFHPWHRKMVQAYESEFRELCSYQGAQPYWDWSLHAGSEQAFINAPVFHAVRGFGGNGQYVDTSTSNQTNIFPDHIPGKTGGGCVLNGPFVNVPVNLGPGHSVAYNPRCLKRDFSPYLASFTLNISVVNQVLSANSYAIFDLRAQNEGLGVPDMTYHGGGHLAVGGDTGDVGNPYHSPSDPLFYLHHANMDHLWNKWQRANWPARKNDIAGPDTQFAYPWNFFGDIPYQNITLDYQMTFIQLLAPRTFVKIRDVMDITSADLCYTYDS